MVSFTTLLLSAAAGTALAQTAPDVPSDWTWHVSGYSGGCARSGCYYDFNVTVPATSNIAEAKAYCSGYENGAHFTPCRLFEGSSEGIAARYPVRETDDGTGPKKIEISFEVSYQDSGAGSRYNYTGSHEAIYNQFVAPVAEFDVKPELTSAVAK